MTAIIEGTKDIEVRLVFNNAGYMVVNLFGNETSSTHRKNFECLATCNISITHHFLQLMQKRKQTGLIAFTSSASAFLFSPACGLYSPSKCMITNFACNLALENRDLGIEVVVVSPGPSRSNFSVDLEEKLGSLKAGKTIANEPDDVARCFFKAAGRQLMVDQGLMTMGFRLLNKLVDVMEIASRVGHPGTQTSPE